MNKWINRFHNTEAKSKLTKQDISDIDYDVHSGRIDKSDNKYRQMRRLNNKLCGIRDCQCGAFNEMERTSK